MQSSQKSERLFKATPENPYHLSVGAILRNDAGLICCHHFDDLSTKNPKYEKLKDFYLLMRETMKNGETIEAAVERGLLEEFGATGEIVRFVGTLISRWNTDGIEYEKTTLYFEVRLASIDESKRSQEDIEGETELMWLSREDLMKRMSGQKERLGNNSLDESEILLRVQ